MKRVSSLILWVMGAVLLLSFGVMRTQAQAAQPATPPGAPQQEQAQPVTPPSGKEAEKKDAEEQQNPFAPEPAPALPPGMAGSDVNDPRFKLAPGLYDAGEAAMGIEHVLLLKKPDAFQLASSDPDDPKVQKTLAQLGVGGGMKIPKPIQLVIAQLAFANSDLAFQGNHLFLGNFYGVNIFDIANPAKAKLLTSLVCPGGQGDVSVYKNLLFMSVEMPNGRLDCGAELPTRRRGDAPSPRQLDPVREEQSIRTTGDSARPKGRRREAAVRGITAERL